MNTSQFTNVAFGAMGAMGRSAGAAACTSQIELTLSCQNLLNMDVMSKSDPFCGMSKKK